MKILKLTFSFFLIMVALQISAQRVDTLLNQDWQFRFSHDVDCKSNMSVDLPHTWNVEDALSGKMDYKRGIGNYTKKILIRPEWQEKRLFLFFEGANSVSNVFVNGKHIGEHRGGYGAFIFEITDVVDFGKENSILVRVNNGEQLDVMPLVGDFNFYGGIYRDVHLLITDKICVSPLDYASSGVYLIQKKVTDKQAIVCAHVKLSNSTDQSQNVVVGLKVSDASTTIYETTKNVNIASGTDFQTEDFEFTLDNPHLWNGVDDPFMYNVSITLSKDGNVLDEIEQPLGLRYFSVDADKGFFLNGKHLQLRGVCRHQDRAEIGNALLPEHHEEDTRIMLDMGVNAIRLAHYPQAIYMYDLMDKYGIVTWAEIPFVGPGGYNDKGFVDQPSFRNNGKQQLIEMIRQHYNHPSICFWGLFNELKEFGDNPVEYLKELETLTKQEDSSRMTTSATNTGGKINFITDNIAWNRYDGWYGSVMATLATWLDDTHKNHPELKIGISEYGAGASIIHQQDSLVKSVPTSYWHPENWQTEYHIKSWEIINERPFVWGSFIWNMFDFGAAHRREGDRNGINDKGLVTYDRKVKKDAYFFYKANWNPEPMVYIAGKRNVNRTKQITEIQVFSNCDEVSLTINGKHIGKMKPDKLRICLFENIDLSKGDNVIEVVAKNKKTTLTDSCHWILQ